MLNGNLYGLIITMLTFVIAVVLTMKQVEQSGVHVEFIIRPITVGALGKEQPREVGVGKTSRSNPEAGADENSSRHVTVQPRQQVQ